MQPLGGQASTASSGTWSRQQKAPGEPQSMEVAGLEQPPKTHWPPASAQAALAGDTSTQTVNEKNARIGL